MDDVKQSIMTQPEKVEYIISGCCDYFGITKDDIARNTGSRSSIWDKKRFIVYLLFNHTPCNTTDITKYLGYKSRRNVSYHIKMLEDELSENTYGNNKTKMIYNELLSYLNLKS